MTLTPWFNARRDKPVRPGVYKVASAGAHGFARWDGRWWFSVSRIVGTYSTSLTSEGYVVESEVSEETQDQFERAKEANARLIATAPRLLAALEAMLEEGDGGRAAAEARAAIAQARGLEGGVA